MFLVQTLKWVTIALVSSYVIISGKRQTTLGSLSKNYSDIYAPDFYPNGTDLELPLGTMRYWLFGDQKGKPVVLVHGISTGSAIYDKLARELANNGHHVLVYDLWGRGFSEAPPVRYDEALYTSQLAMLLQKVGWTHTDLVGVSLGGGIVTSFAAFYPEMVNKLVLVAPTGLMHVQDMPWISKVVQIPHAYPFIMNQPYIRPLIVSLVKRFAKSTRLVQSNLDQETSETLNRIADIATYQFVHHPGFLRAFLGTVVDFSFTGLIERYRKVGQQQQQQQQQQKRILMIWGDKDSTVPYYHAEEAKELLPNAELITYKGQGHDVILSRWRSVNKDIEQFLVE